MVIEDDSPRSDSDGALSPFDDLDSDLPTFTSFVPKQVRQAHSKTFLANDLALISKQFQVLLDCFSGIMDPPQPSPPPDSDPQVSVPVAPRLLFTPSQDDVVTCLIVSFLQAPTGGIRT